MYECRRCGTRKATKSGYCVGCIKVRPGDPDWRDDNLPGRMRPISREESVTSRGFARWKGWRTKSDGPAPVVVRYLEDE